MWLTCWHGRSRFCWCSLPSPRRTLSCWKQWSTIQFSSTYSYCFMLVLMSLRLPLMWKQNLYLFLIFCVCMFVFVWTWKCEHTPEKVNGRRQDGREIVRKSRPICEKELSPLRRSVRICLQASFTPSFVNTFPLLSPLPVQPLNTQVFCCCTLPIFKLYGNVCLRCYPKDNTLLLVWHSKDRGWHTPKKETNLNRLAI